MIPSEARFLRLHVNSSDRWHGTPLDRAVVEKARSMGRTGASDFRVELGSGANRRLNGQAERLRVR